MERKTGEVVSEYSDQLQLENYLSSGVFSKDQGSLITGSEDGNILVYDILTVGVLFI